MSIATVFNKDCLEELFLMDDCCFDLALIDPPYFDYKTGHRKDKSDKLSQSIIQQSRTDQIAVVQECIRVLKPNSAFFLFTNWENIYWMQEPLQSFFRNMIVWDKGNWSAGDLKGSFGNRYEIAFLGVKGKDWTYRGGRDNDIWSIARMGSVRIHSTEKPVELYKKCINVACDSGSLILDPYGGSGSSAEAALEMDCNIVVYEKDAEYCKRIENRLDNWKKSKLTNIQSSFL
jgi:site-specific DNA-methyltransferase (adenine-specific)